MNKPDNPTYGDDTLKVAAFEADDLAVKEVASLFRDPRKSASQHAPNAPSPGALE